MGVNSMNDILQILTQILTIFGGGAVIALAIIRWFGGVWEKRIIENEKAKHAIELEALKNRYTREFEEYKSNLQFLIARSARFDNGQFETYLKIWESLQELKFAGDALWNRANRENLLSFKDKLEIALLTIHAKALFFDEEHYKELNELVRQFQRFSEGKEMLIAIRERNLENDIAKEEIKRQVDQNRHLKSRYDDFIDLLRLSFADKLRQPL